MNTNDGSSLGESCNSYSNYETGVIVRFSCIGFTVLSNIIACIYVYHKLYNGCQPCYHHGSILISNIKNCYKLCKLCKSVIIDRNSMRDNIKQNKDHDSGSINTINSSNQIYTQSQNQERSHSLPDQIENPGVSRNKSHLNPNQLQLQLPQSSGSIESMQKFRSPPNLHPPPGAKGFPLQYIGHCHHTNGKKLTHQDRYRIRSSSRSPPPSSRAKEDHGVLDPAIVGATFCYIFLATITTLYNLVYRYVIANNYNRDNQEMLENACYISDVIDEYSIIFSRMFLILFFTYRVEKVFKNSLYSFNQVFINIFRLVIIVEHFSINSLWILNTKVCPRDYENFGIYCWNSGEEVFVYTHFGMDTLFNITLVSMFANRLTKITFNLQEMNKLKSRHHDHKSTPRTRRRNDTRARQATSNQNFELILVALRQVTFVLISITSSWLFYLASVSDADGLLSDVFSILRWFYPLDWTINVWCVVLMFKFNNFGILMNCICCIYCYKIPCFPKTWKIALKDYSTQSIAKKNLRSQSQKSKSASSPSVASATSASPQGINGKHNNVSRPNLRVVASSVDDTHTGTQKTTPTPNYNYGHLKANARRASATLSTTNTNTQTSTHTNACAAMINIANGNNIPSIDTGIGIEMNDIDTDHATTAVATESNKIVHRSRNIPSFSVTTSAVTKNSSKMKTVNAANGANGANGANEVNVDANANSQVLSHMHVLPTILSIRSLSTALSIATSAEQVEQAPNVNKIAKIDTPITPASPYSDDGHINFDNSGRFSPIQIIDSTNNYTNIDSTINNQ